MSLHVLSTTVRGKLGSSKTYNVDLTGKTVIITGAVRLYEQIILETM